MSHYAYVVDCVKHFLKSSQKSFPVLVVLMFLFSGFYIVAGINQPGNTGNPSPINTPYVSTSNYEVTFTETGLPSGMNWGVQVGSFYVSGNTSSLSIQLPDGSYNYYVFESGISDYLYSGFISVSGNSLSLNFNFYKVSLQTDVGPGSELYIEITNSTGLSIITIITNGENLYLPDGNFSYSLGIYNLTDNNCYRTGGGYFLVNNSGVTKTFAFDRILFSTSGLPAGVNASWEVSVYNAKSGISASLVTYNSSLSFYLPSGNYSYSASVDEAEFYTPGYSYFARGYINTSISSVVPTFIFKNVVFTSTDLPYGSYWGISLYNFSIGSYFTFQVNSSLSKISAYLPSGSYQYESALFSPSDLNYPSYQNFSSVDLNVSENTVKMVSFHGVYNLTFNASGLPGGNTYKIILNQLPSLDLSSSHSISVFIPNGYYTYTVSNNQASFSTTYRVEINNQSAVVNLDFYPLEFKASGPPSYFCWESELFNTSNSAFIGSSLTVFNNYTYYLLPGNYSYTFHTSIDQSSNYPANDVGNATTPGKVSITDGPFIQDVSFNLVPGYYYLVLDLKFSSSAFIYSLSLTNKSGYFDYHYDFYIYSSVNTMTFIVQNGTYSYYLYVDYSYRSTTFSGNIRINGTTIIKAIDLTGLNSAFNVHFLETGLPSGDRWSVTIDNISHNSTSDSINFAFIYPLPLSQTYLSFVVVGPSGFSPSPEHGCINVDYGSRINLNVSFSNSINPLGHVSSTILSNTNSVMNGIFYTDCNFYCNPNTGGVYVMTTDPSNNLVYFVSYHNRNEISSLNISSEVVRPVEQVSCCLNSLAYDSQNGMLYFDAGYIIGEISTSSNNLILQQSTLSFYTNDLLYNPLTNLLYTYSPANGNISIFNATTLKITDSLKASTTPNTGVVESMTYNPVSGDVIIKYLQSCSLGVLDINNNSLSAVKLNFYPTSITYDTSTNTVDVFGVNCSGYSFTGVFESLNDRNYSVVKLKNISEIVTSSYFNPNNGYFYLVVYNSTSYLYDYGNVLVLNGQNCSLLGTITVASDPTDLIYVPGYNVLVVSSGLFGILSIVELPGHPSSNIAFIIILGSIVAAIVIVGSVTALIISRRSKLKSAK